jgi:hypothetical protein
MTAMRPACRQTIITLEDTALALKWGLSARSACPLRAGVSVQNPLPVCPLCSARNNSWWITACEQLLPVLPSHALYQVSGLRLQGWINRSAAAHKTAGVFQREAAHGQKLCKAAPRLPFKGAFCNATLINPTTGYTM